MNEPVKSPCQKKVQTVQHILLANDDIDDCLLFKEALDELALPVELTVVHNGEQLMQLLGKNLGLPDLLFLDVNMPRKNGLTCLHEIKEDPNLKRIPVIMLSTSFNSDTIKQFRQSGAQQCFRKPNDFPRLKDLIGRALQAASQTVFNQVPTENFMLSHEPDYHETE